MPRFVAYAWVGRPERGVDLPPSGVVLHLYGPLPCGMPVWFVCRSLPLTSTNDFSDAGNTVPARGHDALPQWFCVPFVAPDFNKRFSDAETLSPQEAMTLFRNGAPFCGCPYWKRNFSNGRFPLPACSPTNWNVRALTAFLRQAGRLFCRSGSRTQNKAELLKEALRARRISLGRILMGTGGISGLEHTRAAALFCAGTAFYLRVLA